MKQQICISAETGRLYVIDGTGGVKAQELVPYKNPDLPVEVRVKDLLQRMTLEEKVDQLNMKSLNALQTDNAGQVTDSSLVRLFQGRSIGCLESPFVEHHKVALYAEAADHYYGHRPVWGFRPYRSQNVCMGRWLWVRQSSAGNRSGVHLESGADQADGFGNCGRGIPAGVDQALSPLF